MAWVMIYIGLGSNLCGGYGDSAALLGAALARLQEQRVRVVRTSPFYASAAVGPGRQGDYVNAVIAADSVLPPSALLAVLHRLERAFGRQRRVKWGARTLDLDILDYRGTRAAYPHLPHPRLHQRAFVLKPLRDIAPAWRCPASRHSVHRLLAALPPALLLGCQPIS